MTEVKEETVSFPATVIRIIDYNKVVINRGTKHGIKENQHFLVYHLETNPMKDPETREDLGQLEIIRGTGIATHVQENMTTVSSDRKGPTERRVVRRSGLTWASYSGGSEEEKVTIPGKTEPFDGAVVGDKAKPI